MAERQELGQGSFPFAAGATPVDAKQNSRPSTAKQGSSNWYADDDPSASLDPGKDGANQQHKDREERLRVLREKQNEERHRKLEELKQQALAAQKFREQKEEERRRRLEELRIRDSDRRQQVEERKRQIWEAERDRREAILRKNQEREARIESKRKNERSSIVFAFGSSTPRMLEPGDTTGTSYWATRRATSTTNVMTLSLSAAPGPLTRRSSERELDGSKKRAVSAGGIERKTPHDETDGVVGGVRAARRKTDLMPTIPSPRDTTPVGGSRSKGLGSKSPGRAYSMSRLDILAQPRRPRLVAIQTTPPDLSRSMSTLPGAKPLKKAADTSRSMLHLGAPPLRPTRAEKLRQKAREAKARSQSLDQPPSPGLRSGEITPSRPTSSMSQHSVASNLSNASATLRARSANTPRRPRPFSIAVTGVSTDKNSTEKPPIPKVHAPKKAATPKPEVAKKPNIEKSKPTKSSTGSTPKTTPLQSPVVETAQSVPPVSDEKAPEGNKPTLKPQPAPIVTELVAKEDSPKESPPIPPFEVIPDRGASPDNADEKLIKIEEAPTAPPPTSIPTSLSTDEEVPPDTSNPDLAEADMTASMIARTRITTEEEAKAALAERRRIAREQAEREAELERQRIEAERKAEEERLRREEEEQRRMEEEQLRLLEEARKAEELRLQQAILEAQKREEEEKKKKEEEARLKVEKEEAEKKAKEEAEKMRIEMEVRLKKEEEDRIARRKRVEAIMLRTRGKGSNASSPNPSKEGQDSEESPPDETKKSNESLSEHDKFLNSERSHSDANNSSTPYINNKHNGHHNGSFDTVSQNNVTNSLLDLSTEVHEPVGQILDLPSGNGKLPDTQLQPPFIAFQDKKEPHTVNDLLS